VTETTTPPAEPPGSATDPASSAPPPANGTPTPPAPPSEPADGSSRPDGAPDLAAVESETLRSYIRRLERQNRDHTRAERERTEASRSDIERATDRASTAEQRVAQLENELLRIRLALRAFPEDATRALELAPRATGASEEELWADFAKLRELVGGNRPGQRPPVDFGSGSRLGENGQSGGGPGSFDQAIRRAAGH
jgi:hypothetical protein